MRPNPSFWRRVMGVCSMLAAYVGSLLASRWAMGMGTPGEDLRPVRNLLTDVRYYWRWRGVYAARVIDGTYSALAMFYDECSGATRRRLRLLRTRIREGAYADDTHA